MSADVGPRVTAETPEDQLPPLQPAAANSGLLEVFRQRYLLRLLVKSTVQSRYQGTFLGWFWSYFQPFTQFLMFYFVFQVLIGRGSNMENFAIHLIAGLVVVHFFTETFNGGTRSLVSNRGLIIKLPVPRELFPVATMLVSLYHSVPMVIIMIIASALLGWTPDPAGLLAALLGFAIIAVLGLSLALIFSVANVYFRDFQKVTQILTQFTRFSVPMIYPFSMVESRFEAIPWVADVYLLNPLAEAVLLVQRGFWIGTNSDPAAAAAEHLPDDLWSRGIIMFVVSCALLVLAQLWFSKLERRVPERL